MSQQDHINHINLSRRGLLQAMAGAGLVAGLPLFNTAHAATSASSDKSKRILVVLELSGANDGFNTLVPYADDAYYRLRPKIGIRPNKVRKIDDQFGFSPGMAGFERLFKDGKMAVVIPAPFRNIMPPTMSFIASICRRYDKERAQLIGLELADRRKKLEEAESALKVIDQHIKKWKDYNRGNKEVPDKIAVAMEDLKEDLVDFLKGIHGLNFD